MKWQLNPLLFEVLSEKKTVIFPQRPTQTSSPVLRSFSMMNTSLVLPFRLAVFKAPIHWAIKTNVTGPRLSSLPIQCRAAHHPLILQRHEIFPHCLHRCTIFPLSVSTSELPVPTHCQSFTVEWKMCPISLGQANNDWKAIEVMLTDSIQLAIAVFASVSTWEEVNGKTFFFFHTPYFPSFIQVLTVGQHNIQLENKSNNFLLFCVCFFY